MAGFYGRTSIDVRDTLSTGLLGAGVAARELAIQACTQAAAIIAERAYQNANVSPGVLGHGIHGEHMRDEIRLEEVIRPTEVIVRVIINIASRAICVKYIPSFALQFASAFHFNPFIQPAIAVAIFRAATAVFSFTCGTSRS